jgi:hypothetical protein
MTRARLYALAVLAGLCCLGHRSVLAQAGPGAPAYGFPGPAYPYETPTPPPDDTCRIDPDAIVTSGTTFGPLVHTDGAFLRVEYLNYTIKKPGNELLGAPVAGVADPTKPFIAFEPGTSTAIGLATVPSTAGMNLGSMSGVQVTGGLSFIDDGSIEISAFFLGRKQTGFTIAPLGETVTIPTGFFSFITVPTVVATSTLANGNVSDHLLLYDTSYSAVMQSQLWGGEANYFYDYDAVGLLQLRPLIGARYLNLTERITQTGVFQGPLAAPPIVSTIDAHTTNNLYGFNLGFRTEVVTKYLELGLTPKILLLGNTMNVNTFTNHLRSNADPVIASTNTTSTFSFGSEVGVFATINFTPSFSLRGGYNLIWLNRVTRPQKDVYYNDNGDAAPPAIISRTIFSDVLITGFTFGAEFRF